MSSNLYETLGISRHASPEDIRKAYRRKALETHPDRLPPGASPADKAASEDLFRKVNNAYEVLSDPQNRSSYDKHGVWPPPMPSPQGPFTNNAPHDPFPDAFFRDTSPFFRGPRMDPFAAFGFGSRPTARGFTDPFVLFDSIFGDFHRALEVDPFFDGSFTRRGFGLGPSPSNRGFFDAGFPPMMMPSPFDVGGGGMGSSSRVQSFSNAGNGPRWVSESWSTSTVNGVTHTKSVRRDSEGNEHVTYRFPDGTERRTINGVDQSAASQPQRALPSNAPPAPPVSTYSSQAVAMPPPPPPYSEAMAQPPHRSHSSRHYGHYDDYSGDRHAHRDHGHHDDYSGDRHGHRHRHRHDHSSRDKERDRDRYGYHDSDGRGHDAQNSSSWKFWRT